MPTFSYLLIIRWGEILQLSRCQNALKRRFANLYDTINVNSHIYSLLLARDQSPHWGLDQGVKQTYFKQTIKFPKTS